MSDEALII